jgi:cytosine/adenosine deaminase-related metal-dependent hydrolase
MRALLAVQRMRGSLGNDAVDRPQLTARDVVGIATRHGARTIGLEDECGTLTPGKKADIILIDCSTPNIFPLSNAFGTVALGADVDAVRAVMVAGTFKKWGDALVDVDLHQIQEMIETSRDHLAAKVGFEIDLFADYPSIDLGTHTLRM